MQSPDEAGAFGLKLLKLHCSLPKEKPPIMLKARLRLHGAAAGSETMEIVGTVVEERSYI